MSEPEFDNDAERLAMEIGTICDKEQTGAILQAISIILSDVIEELPIEAAIPLLLEVLNDSILMAYDVDTEVSMRNMQ